MFWHTMGQPHTPHNPARYWLGVASLVNSSHFASPMVGSRRQLQGAEPEQQPAVSGRVQLAEGQHVEPQGYGLHGVSN